MCCLFGMVNYSGKKNVFADTLVNNLAQEATIRGVDSTGIAYNKNGKLIVYKKPLSAYELEFKNLEDCVCVTGHTRHATQGSHKLNYNNHPFLGNCDGVKFALSHNGVLWNDTTLRRTYQLPKPKIETDSYIAVQLLEHFQKLSFANVAKMAEAVSGSFSFTMVDNNNTLWIVKGDSPLTLVHFPARKMYVYASTDEILFSAMAHTNLIQDIIDGDFDLVHIKNGDILKIDKRGKITKHNFKPIRYDYRYDWNNWNTPTAEDFATDDTPEDDEDLDFYRQWLRDIKAVAHVQGYTDKDIDDLLDDGFTLEEIEDFIYYQ